MVRIEIPTQTSIPLLAELIHSPHRSGNSLCYSIEALADRYSFMPETLPLIEKAIQMPEADSSTFACALRSLIQSGLGFPIAKQMIGSSQLDSSELPSIRYNVENSQRLTKEQKSDLLLYIGFRNTLGLEGMRQLDLLGDLNQTHPTTEDQISQQLEKSQQLESTNTPTDQAPASHRTQKGN